MCIHKTIAAQKPTKLCMNSGHLSSQFRYELNCACSLVIFDQYWCMFGITVFQLVSFEQCVCHLYLTVGSHVLAVI
jgi:hypothetical protein